jgi:phosphatidylglycerol:prolipoprotein diacylglycerol transferase
MRPILFELGPLKLHSYGLLLVIGFFAGVWNACREAERRGYKAELILDMALPLLLASVAACRLLYVFLNLDQFHNVADVFKVWDGGLSFHGAFFGALGVLGFFSYTRKIPFAVLFDLIAPSIFLGYFFGRIGCLLNGCCYGHACDLPWAMRFPDEHHRGFLTPPSHPAQLYSAIMALGLFALMQKAKLSPLFDRFHGQLTLLFFALYAVERGVMEYFRNGATAPAAFGLSWLTSAQLVSIVAIAIIALLWFYLSRRKAGTRPSSLIPHPSDVSTG